MVDTDGKPWVVEMSSEFAPLYGVMAFYYKCVYQDYYNKKLHSSDEAQIDILLRLLCQLAVVLGILQQMVELIL